MNSSAIRIAKSEEARAALLEGIAAAEAGALAESIVAIQQALQLEPNNPTGLFHLAMALYKRGDHAAARPLFAQVCGLRPDYSECWFRWAACSLALCEHADALRGYQRAYALDPTQAYYLHGLATVHAVLGDKETALAEYRACQVLRPGYAWGQFSEAVTLAQMGRWLEAWPKFEARSDLGVTSQPIAEFPRWEGQPVEDRAILIRTEQGLGDMIMMARYVGALLNHGARVYVETRTELLRLFRCLGATGLYQSGQAFELPETPDWWEHAMSLPWRFETSPASEPWEGVYIAPHAADVSLWRRRVWGLQRPRIGLCWRGGHEVQDDPSLLAINRRRNLDIAALAPWFGVPGVSWVSLVPGHAAPEPLWDRTGLLGDMADTAALLAHLDLVITVDSAMVHLAGAMGVPCWLVDRFDHCWRWLPNSETSPWYPSLRIFRQQRLGEWGPVIARVGRELERWSAEVRAAYAGTREDDSRGSFWGSWL